MGADPFFANIVSAGIVVLAITAITLACNPCCATLEVATEGFTLRLAGTHGALIPKFTGTANAAASVKPALDPIAGRLTDAEPLDAQVLLPLARSA